METVFKNISCRESHQIAHLTLGRGELNILSLEMLQEMNQVLADWREDASLRAVVITHEGRCFSAGLDVKEYQENSEKAVEMIATYHELFRSLEQLPCPTVSCVRGPALGGGCELALFTDFLLAGESAQFGQPETRLGCFPPVAVSFLPRRMGWHRAMEFILLGQPISARQAQEWGLATQVFPDERFAALSHQYLQNFSASSAQALRLAKQAMKRGGQEQTLYAMEKARELYLKELITSEEAAEGISAFLEKRQPRWAAR